MGVYIYIYIYIAHGRRAAWRNKEKESEGIYIL